MTRNRYSSSRVTRVGKEGMKTGGKEDRPRKKRG